MTEVFRVDPASPDGALVERAAERLRAGGLVAFPTETVYGLGVHALFPAALARLFAAKRRPATDPLIVHVTSLEDARPLVEMVSEGSRLLAAAFWPGPLTLVMRRSATVPDAVTAGLDTVAIRVPAHPVARAIIRAAAVPIAAPSANLFSRPSPTCADHVLEDLAGRIDLVVDGGPTTIGVESTVLDLSADTPIILRPGAVTLEMLRSVVPGVRGFSPRSADGTAPMPAPGMLDKHYAPRAALTLYEGADAASIHRLAAAARHARQSGLSVGILVAAEDTSFFAQDPELHIASIGSADDLPQVAAGLYAALRELDRLEVDVILARAFRNDEGLGTAIRDRLTRAAARIVPAPR